MQTATKKDGLRVTPLSWEETRDLLRPLFKDHAHWIIVGHYDALSLIHEIERRYYLGYKNRDFTLVTSEWQGQHYVLVAAKKRQMRGWQLAGLLKRWTDVKITADALTSRDLFIAAPDATTEAAATALAAHIFNERDLAFAA